MTEDQEILSAAVDWKGQGKGVAIATVTAWLYLPADADPPRPALLGPVESGDVGLPRPETLQLRRVDVEAVAAGAGALLGMAGVALGADRRLPGRDRADQLGDPLRVCLLADPVADQGRDGRTDPHRRIRRIVEPHTDRKTLR